MGRNLCADRVQREEQRFGDDGKSNVGEERDEQCYQHDHAQHEGQHVCPVAQQQITELPARAVKVVVNALPACIAGAGHCCGDLMYLFYTHGMLPVMSLNGHLLLC